MQILDNKTRATTPDLITHTIAQEKSNFTRYAMPDLGNTFTPKIDQ